MSKFEMRDLKTGDIYKMSRILKRLDIKTDDINIDENSRVEHVGMDVIKKVLENLHLAEKEVNEFLAELVGITPDEFAELPLGQTMEVLSQFKNQEDIGAFLKLAGK